MSDALAPEVLVSAIEHYSYCPRQCALIHVEQIFDENVFTIRGRLAHERIDDAGGKVTRGVRLVRSLPIWSDRLALRGKCDLVEFRSTGPFPVEYKLGNAATRHAELQLCAQGLCLEEMTGEDVPRGALFLYQPRRRHEVIFDDALRDATVAIVREVRSVLRQQRLPEAPNDARCPPCSLVFSCLPGVVADRDRMRGLQGALWRPLAAGSDGS